MRAEMKIMRYSADQERYNRTKFGERWNNITGDKDAGDSDQSRLSSPANTSPSAPDHLDKSLTSLDVTPVTGCRLKSVVFAAPAQDGQRHRRHRFRRRPRPRPQHHRQLRVRAGSRPAPALSSSDHDGRSRSSDSKGMCLRGHG